MSRTTRRSDQRARRRTPRQRRMQRGQTLIVFALSVTVLLGLAGLAIDVMRAYDQYAHEERAAEAGALAGVIYMPNFYDTPATAIDNNCAQSRALLEVQKNGFGTTSTGTCSTTNDCDAKTGVPVTEVAVCRATNISGTALQVTISEPITIFLLSFVNVQNFNVSTTAGADYLDVNVLGSNPGPGDTNIWGDGGTNNPKYFNPTIDGPAEFKEMGDPFVYCEDGVSTVTSPNFAFYSPLAVPLTRNLNNVITQAGFTTNHLPYPLPLCGASQPDQQPPGFTGEATRGTVHPGAYNFAITGQQNDTIWIYNAPFAPNDPQSSCNGSQTLDAYMQDNSCSIFYTTYGPLLFDGSHFDDPRFGFNVTYSLYEAQSNFTRLADKLITTQQFNPMDQIKADLSVHSCNTGESYLMTDHSTYTKNSTGQGFSFRAGCYTPAAPTGCPSTPNAYNSNVNAEPAPYTWVCIGSLPATDTYRLAVEASPYNPNGNNNSCPDYTCGWGRHTYAIADCAASWAGPPSNGVCTGGGKISGWNNFDLYLNFPSATKNNIYVPIANIPRTYAGRTVELRLFNPGPTHGNGDDAYFTIVPPDPCITMYYGPLAPIPTTTTWERLVPYPGTLFPALTGGKCPQQTTALYASASQPPPNQAGPSDEIYKGLWVDVTFQLPPTFQGGQFWLDNFSAKGKNFNQMAVTAQLAGSGSPVHLIF
jgi:Flp pilus assembly protein TadG